MAYVLIGEFYFKTLNTGITSSDRELTTLWLARCAGWWSLNLMWMEYIADQNKKALSSEF